MKLQSNKSWTYWLRVIHRDLGFLMIGLCLVYGISGIMLNHMNGKDPAFHTEQQTVTLNAGLDAASLAQAWASDSSLPALKRVFQADGDNLRLIFEGGVGIYNIKTGNVDYERYTRRPFIYWVNRLHFNRLHGWSYAGDFFAVSLIFFAISGMLMVKGKNGLRGRGKWYLLVGILIPILYIIFA